MSCKCKLHFVPVACFCKSGPASSGERHSHSAAFLTSPKGLPLLTQWVQSWSHRRLASAFTEPCIFAKVTGGDAGGGKARLVAFEEVLLKLATSLILRPHLTRRLSCPIRNLSHGRRVEDSRKDGERTRQNLHRLRREERLRSCRRAGAVEGARRWCPVMRTIFANLWAGRAQVQPTAWVNTQNACQPIVVRDGVLQGGLRGPSGLRLGPPHRAGEV